MFVKQIARLDQIGTKHEGSALLAACEGNTLEGGGFPLQEENDSYVKKFHGIYVLCFLRSLPVFQTNPIPKTTSRPTTCESNTCLRLWLVNANHLKPTGQDGSIELQMECTGTAVVQTT